jgi:hypothetical protein
MKAALLIGALALGLTACVAAPEAAAPAQASSTGGRSVASTAVTPARPSVVRTQLSADWIDAPLTLGNWAYENRGSLSLAVFNETGRGAMMAIQCRAPSREVWLVMAGQAVASPTMQVRTETTTRAITAQLSVSERSNVTATLTGSDPLLDAIALSKGRFAVETEGLPPLILPTWAEVTRVIEDCR